MPPATPYTLLVPEYLEFLLAPQYAPDAPTPTDAPKQPLHPLGTPNAPYTPSGPWVPRVTAGMKLLLKFTPQVSYFQF